MAHTRRISIEEVENGFQVNIRVKLKRKSGNNELYDDYENKEFIANDKAEAMAMAEKYFAGSDDLDLAKG